MNHFVLMGLVVGATMGVGLWLIIAGLFQPQSSSVLYRVAVSISDISSEAFQVATEKSAGEKKAISLIASWITKYSGSIEKLQIDLNRAHSELSVSEFRARQAVWGVWSAVVGLAAVTVLSFIGSLQPIALPLLPLVASFAGVFVCRKILSIKASQNMKVLESQIPVVWEFISLSLAAGENLTDALKRISRIGHGILIDQLREVVDRHSQGIPLALCLETLSKHFELPALTRGIEQLLIALHRGTPLVGVLQAQAQDAREDSKRNLLESAGKKEVLMLFPLIFLILPVTILFAVFPGLLVVQTGF